MRRLFFALILICASVGAQENVPVKEEPQQQPAAKWPHADEDTLRNDGPKDEAAKRAVASGWQRLKSGNPAAAIKLFNKAAMLNPNDANAYWGMGAATAQQRKFGIAVQLFERAGSLDPKNVRLAADAGLAYARAATDNLADLAERAKSLQKALAWLDKAEKLDPTYALTYANRAIALSFLGDYDRAWSDVARAEALDKNSVDPKLIAYLSEKRTRPEPEAAAEGTRLAQAELPKAPPPVVKESVPVVQQAAPSAASSQAIETQPAASTATQPAEPAAKEVAQPESQPESAAPAAAETKPEPTREKTLRVITGQPVGRKDRDVRNCLDLPTNEAIIRCVYPRR